MNIHLNTIDVATRPALFGMALYGYDAALHPITEVLQRGLGHAGLRAHRHPRRPRALMLQPHTALAQRPPELQRGLAGLARQHHALTSALRNDVSRDGTVCRGAFELRGKPLQG